MRAHIRVGISAFAVLVATSVPTFAQEAAQATSPESGALQEIVVTAQKRSENVQSVPVAITAVSAASLQAKGIHDVVDLAGQAPNVTLRSTAQFGGSSSVLISYIRGIGQNDFAFNLEPGVGVYIDGVYLARNIGANADLLDLDHVEVLKGPQGTLFGRNTMGGAINIVTRDPANDFQYKGELTTGQYNRIDFRGSIDAPIVKDKLLFSVAVSTKHRDGYQHRIPYTGDTADNPILLAATNGATGGPSNTNTVLSGQFPITDSSKPDNTSGNQDETSVRAKLLWHASDRLKVELIGDYLNVNEEAAPFSLLQVNQAAYVAIYNTCITGNPQVYAGVAAMTGLPGVAAVCGGTRGNAASPWGVQAPLGSLAGQLIPYDNRFVIHNADGSINPDLSYATGANYNIVKNGGVNLQLNYELNDNNQIKSITGYRKLNSRFGADVGGDPSGAFAPSFADHEHQFSEELQLIGSAFAKRWKYVFGAYYFNEAGSHEEGVSFPGGLLQIYSPNDTYDTKSYALYTHNNIDIIPYKLGITIGARYTHEDKQFAGTQQDENEFVYKLAQLPTSVLPIPSEPYWLYPTGLNKQKFDNFSYRIGAEYHVDQNVMAYASFATAFKGGGWTTRLTGPLFNATTGTPLPAPTFGPEKAYTSEIGIKSMLFARKVRLNAAIFNTEYKNIQLTFVNGTSPVTTNGGNGRIRGAEAETNVKLTRQWSLDASAGYLDAKYTSILSGVPLSLTDQFVNTPHWTAQAGTSYDIGSSIGTFVPRVDWTYASKSYNDETNTEILATPAHSFFNGSVTYKMNNSRVEIQAGVTNIFDKRIVMSGFENADAVYSGVFSPPREWFLSLRIKN